MKGKFVCYAFQIDGTTPLCAAALWGNNDMVKLLLEAGANVDAQNRGSSNAQIDFIHQFGRYETHSPLYQQEPFGHRYTLQLFKNMGRLCTLYVVLVQTFTLKIKAASRRSISPASQKLCGHISARKVQTKPQKLSYWRKILSVKLQKENHDAPSLGFKA